MTSIHPWHEKPVGSITIIVVFLLDLLKCSCLRTHAHTHTRTSTSERERERDRLSCLPFVWHFLFILTHTALERERGRDRLLCLPFVWHFFLCCDTHTHTRARARTALQPEARWSHQPLVAGCQQIDFKFMVILCTKLLCKLDFTRPTLPRNEAVAHLILHRSQYGMGARVFVFMKI